MFCYRLDGVVLQTVFVLRALGISDRFPERSFSANISFAKQFTKFDHLFCCVYDSLSFVSLLFGAFKLNSLDCEFVEWMTAVS